MPEPHISFVIPTRNRANLLPFAIRSVLAQSMTDLEVVVSDNSTDDLTKKAVGEFDDPRVKYVRASGELGMHDSWEFAFTHARGRYVTYLCDDDALVASFAERVTTVERESSPELIVWGQAEYYLDGYYDTEYRGLLLAPPWTGTASPVGSHQELFSLFRLEGGCRPKMLNSMSPRVWLEGLRDRAGRLFFPESPDYAFAALALSSCETFVRVDFPMLVVGMGPQSFGVSSTYGDSKLAQEYYRMLGTELKQVPLPYPSMFNSVARTLMHVKDTTGLVPSDVTLDLEAYFEANYRLLRSHQRNGFDVSEYLSVFRDVVDSQASDLRRSLTRMLRRGSRRESIRRLINSAEWLRRFDRRIRPAPRPRALGEGRRFENILACAEYIDSVLDSSSPST